MQAAQPGGEPCRLVLTALEPLGEGIAERCRQAAAGAGVGLGPFRRLAPTAMECACAPLAPEVIDTVRRTAAAAGADANLVRRPRQPWSVLLCDMDMTLITVETIDEIAAQAGVGAAVVALTERTMRGEMDFAEAVEARLRLCRGLPEAALETIWRERVRLQPGARSLVAGMARQGAETILISGGFSYFAERVAAQAGFDRVLANRLEIEAGQLSGRALPPILGRDAKRVELEAACRRQQTGLEAAVAVGDGANDLAMVAAAGLGVAWRARPVLREAADAVLDFSGLDAVLHLAGVGGPAP